jgi:hypothetical protein
MIEKIFFSAGNISFKRKSSRTELTAEGGTSNGIEYRFYDTDIFTSCEGASL